MQSSQEARGRKSRFIFTQRPLTYSPPLALEASQASAYPASRQPITSVARRSISSESDSPSVVAGVIGRGRRSNTRLVRQRDRHVEFGSGEGPYLLQVALEHERV